MINLIKTLKSSSVIILFVFSLFNLINAQSLELIKAAEQGDALSQALLGGIYHNGEGTPVDMKKAFYWIKKSAEQESPTAQNKLGFMYYNGQGTLTDKKKAFIWFKKSAEQDVDYAQFMLGKMYYSGEGTLTDKKMAKKWIRESYENGNENAKEFWEENELWKY